MQILFLKCLSSSGGILIFFAIATQLPGFFISRLASGEKFFDVNIFFKCKLSTNVSINNHLSYLSSMLLKTLFL